MKRRISLLVCALLLVTFMFVACDENAGHQHTYSDAWSADATNHWHAATCSEADDCATSKTVVAAHADKNKDKVCDVCGYDYGHTHTYAAELSKDETNHWYAVTCGCPIEVKDKAAHVDADNNGVCDTCAFVACEHTYITDAWAMDAEKHWHAASCSHAVVADEEEHDFDEMGLCAVCGYLEGETITVEKAVDLGEFYAGLVNGGTIVESYAYDAYTPASLDTVLFQLGTSNATYAYATEDGAYTHHYVLTADGTVFGVQDGVDFEGMPYAESIYMPESAWVDGYVFSEVFGYDVEQSFTGVDGLIAGLYELAKDSDSFTETVIAYEDAPLYVFSFNSEVLSGYDGQTDETYYYCYSVEVVFSLSDNYTIEMATVNSSTYLCEAVEVEADEEGGAEAEPVYNVVGMVPIVVREWAIMQTEGARELEIAYDPAELLMSEFKLVDEEGNEVGADGTITMEAGSSLALTIVPVTPAEGVVMKLDSIEVVGDGLSASYYTTLYLNAYAPTETAKVTITSTLTTKEYDVVITAPAVTEIYADINGETVSEYTVYGDADGMTEVTFGASVNAYANGAYTAQVSPMNAANLVDNGDGTYTYTLVADMGGYATAEIMLVSAENSEVTTVLTLNVIPAPSVADILVGEFEGSIADSRFSYYNDAISVVLTPESEGALNGTMTVSVTYYDRNTWGEVTYTETLTYAYADGAFTTEYVEGDYEGGLGYTFNFNPATYEFEITWEQGTVALTAVAPVDISNLAAFLTGTSWDCTTMISSSWGDIPAYSLSFDAPDSEWNAINNNSTYAQNAFTWTTVDNTIVITWIDGYDGELADAVWTYDADTNTITATYGDGATYTFTEWEGW